MSTHDDFENTSDKVSNFIDFSLVLTSAIAYLVKGDWPTVSYLITNTVAFIFVALVVPHFIMIVMEKRFFTYHFIKYIIESSQHRGSWIIRNSVIYFIYFYIWSFNLNNYYLLGLSLICFFDVIVLLNILSSSRVAKLKKIFATLPPPKSKID